MGRVHGKSHGSPGASDGRSGPVGSDPSSRTGGAGSMDERSAERDTLTPATGDGGIGGWTVAPNRMEVLAG
jgi:hypothetical protein